MSVPIYLSPSVGSVTDRNAHGRGILHTDFLGFITIPNVLVVIPLLEDRLQYFKMCAQENVAASVKKYKNNSNLRTDEQN